MLIEIHSHKIQWWDNGLVQISSCLSSSASSFSRVLLVASDTSKKSLLFTTAPMLLNLNYNKIPYLV